MTKPVRVQFLVLPHFSLLAFAAAADALTTANLVCSDTAFTINTLSLNAEPVISDLSITIKADHHIDQSSIPPTDILLVCGGYRCDLSPNHDLEKFLRASANTSVTLGGLWNGVIALAYAGLMEGFACALHRDNHAQAQRIFPNLLVHDDSLIFDRTRLTAAGPNSSFELMLLLIQRNHGSETVQAVRHILRADSAQANSVETLEHNVSPTPTPVRLQRALQLMRNNLDEPLSRDDLATHLGLSKRALERLFQQHYNTSPAKYYMDLRLHQAHRMLLQSNSSITSIADDCGFVSGAHFSRRFTKHFGYSPRVGRKNRSSLLEHR